MTRPSDYNFQRYLAAKRTVDDRALNRPVWDALLAALPASETLRVVELGAGIGTMVERLLEWGLPEALRAGGGTAIALDITAVDAESANLRAARTRLARWAEAGGLACAERDEPGAARLRVNGPDLNLDIRLVTGDVFEFAAVPRDKPFDLMIAHAVLDLFDVPRALPSLLALLPPGGLLYATITYDGLTALEPAINPAFDALVERLYHRTMDRRVTAGRQSGDSRAGRHLFHHLTAAGLDVRAMGASDWVVYPVDAAYRGDEAYFLHFIINTIAGALADSADLDGGRFRAWIEVRHRQIERGELVYVAHQLDVMARVGGAPA